MIFTEDGWLTKPELAQFYKSLPALPVPLYWLKTVTVNMTIRQIQNLVHLVYSSKTAGKGLEMTGNIASNPIHI